jgi:hypothetical protein
MHSQQYQHYDKRKGEKCSLDFRVCRMKLREESDVFGVPRRDSIQTAFATACATALSRIEQRSPDWRQIGMKTVTLLSFSLTGASSSLQQPPELAH